MCCFFLWRTPDNSSPNIAMAIVSTIPSFTQNSKLPYIGKFPRYKRFAWKNFTESNFCGMGLPRKFNTTWRGMEETGAYLPISARTVKTILPVWPTFPTRCGTDGFFHFSICYSNCLGWYWGRQQTSWIRKTALLLCFVVEKISCVKFSRLLTTAKIFFNSENFPIYGSYFRLSWI